MQRLNKTNFASIVQEILEQYHLQPLDRSKKSHLKDGYIERYGHGAMHASRSILWAQVMHNLLQKLVPDYTQSSLTKVAQFINTDTDHTFLLILMTVACKNADREGKNEIDYDNESAPFATKVLTGFGVNSRHAELFVNAIIHTHNQSDYLEALEALAIKEEDYPAFDYIRKLVQLSENLDSLRHVTQFHLQSIFDTLATIQGFNFSQHKDTIITLVRAVAEFIHHQGDMSFACDIQDEDNLTVTSYNTHLSSKEKVQREHAENVLAVMFEEACNNPTLKSYLSNIFLEVPQSKPYTGTLKFNPFIHGTNTSTFATLVKTDFQLMSPLEMIDDYYAAPMTGELTQGGYRLVGKSTAKEDQIGKTSFARMTPVNHLSYSLKNVLSNYTTIKPAPENTSLKNFRDALSFGLKITFTNINLLLIYFTRARQTHETLEQVISENELNDLKNNLDEIVQFYYFIQLLGTYIHPDFETIKKSGMESDIFHAAYTLFSFENIIDKIKNHHIDMKAIHKNPTPENLQKALSVLAFPKKCVIKYNSSEKEVEFPSTQFFCLHAASHAIHPSINEADRFPKMLENTPKYQFNDILKEALVKGPAYFTALFKEIGNKTKSHLIAFEDRIRIFNKVAITPQSSFKKIEAQSHLLKKTYPIVFVSENEDKILPTISICHEFRSTTRLKLGTDIKMIATDTHEHRLEIMKYLEINNVRCIQVVLFSNLTASQQSKEKPSEPYHHDNGAPTLKWLCAQRAHRQNVLFKPMRPASDDANSIHSEKNTIGIVQLINDAEQYAALALNSVNK